MAAGSKPFIELGGKSTGAVNAFREVQRELSKTKKEARGVGDAFRRAFRRAFAAVRKLGDYMKSTLLGVFRRLKWAVAGIIATLGASVVAWNKEAAAQARINTLLRANVQNFQQARKELDRMTRITQRKTNYSDRDVEAVFVQFISQMGGRRGFGAARQMLPSILDVASTLQMEPRMVAEAIARNIMAGTVGETFRKFGIRQNVERFRAMSVEQRIGATARDIERLAPGAAAAESYQSPFRRVLNNLSDIFEQVGRVVAFYVNPPLRALADIAGKLADQLSNMGIKRILQTMKQIALEMWADIRSAGLAVWDMLGDRIVRLWEKIKYNIAVGFTIARNYLANTIAGRMFGITPSKGPVSILPPNIGAQPLSSTQAFQQRYATYTGQQFATGPTGRMIAALRTSSAPPQQGLSEDQRMALLRIMATLTFEQGQQINALRRNADNTKANRTRGALMPTG